MSSQLKMLFSIMNPVNGPTPALLIENDTVISDEMWLSGYIDTTLRSFNVIGGFYQGEIQNRLVISVDYDTILLIYGLTLPFYTNDGGSKRPQTYQAVITFIFGQNEEIEHKLYRLVNRIKHELEMVSFTIQASNRFHGLDSFQNLNSFIQTLFTNGETVFDSMNLSKMQKPTIQLDKTSNQHNLGLLSEREQNILDSGLSYVDAESSIDEILLQTGLTYTELAWISRNIEKGKINPIAGPYEKIIHEHTPEKSAIGKKFLSNLKDKILWRRRRKVSHYMLQELNRTLFLLIDGLIPNNSEGRAQAQGILAQEAALLGKRLLADYFSDVGFQEVIITHTEIKNVLHSIWQRNFGYTPEISAFFDSQSDHFSWLILIKDTETSLVGYNRHFGRNTSLCTIIEGVLHGIVDDLINLDTRFTPQLPKFVDVREIRCQSKGYDHCDFEIQVRFNLAFSKINEH